MGLIAYDRVIALHPRFRLEFTDHEFSWAGESRPGFPLMQWPDGSLCEPATAYFGYLCENGRAHPGLLKDAAYVIRDWLAFLRCCSVAWDSVADADLRHYREHHRRWRAEFAMMRRPTTVGQGKTRREASERGKGPPDEARTAHKLAMVFDFYVALPLMDVRGLLSQKLPAIGPLGNAGRELTSKETHKPNKMVRSVWANREAGPNNRGGRPTPSEDEAKRIAGYLRTGNADVDTMSGTDIALGDRDWAMAECMTGPGCRCHEVSALTLSAIWKVLPTTSIVDRIPSKAGKHPLELLAEDEHEGLRQDLLSRIRSNARRGSNTLMIKVAGKGQAREAQFGFKLVLDLLEVVVWGVRHRQVKSMEALDAAYAAPDNVFLSARTGRKLGAGAIGDIMAKAFEDLDIPGSAQRLRARAGVAFAVRLRMERLATGSVRHDDPWSDRELELLREFMGHGKVDTSLRNYVKLASVELDSKQEMMKREDGYASRVKIIEKIGTLTADQLQKLWDQLK